MSKGHYERQQGGYIFSNYVLSIFQIRYFNPKSRDFYFHGVTPAAMPDLTKNNNILVKNNDIKFIYLVVAIDTKGITLL